MHSLCYGNVTTSSSSTTTAPSPCSRAIFFLQHFQLPLQLLSFHLQRQFLLVVERCLVQWPII